MAEAPARPDLGTRCHLPLGLARNLNSIIGKASTAAADEASSSATFKAASTYSGPRGKWIDVDETAAEEEEALVRRRRSGSRRTASNDSARPTRDAHALAASRGTSLM